MAVNDPNLPASSKSKTTGTTPGRATPGSARASSAYTRRESLSDEGSSFSMTGIRTGMMHSMGMKLLLGGLIAIFVGGIAISALSPPSLPGAGNPNVASGGPDVVARVGDETIPRDLFQRSYAQQVEIAQRYGFRDAGATGLMDIRQTTMDSLASEAAQVAEAKRRGITASDADVDKYISEKVDEQFKAQPGQSEAAIRRSVESQGQTLDSAKIEARKGFDRDLVARAVLLEKLQKAVKDENKVTDDDYKRANTKLSLHQIKISPKLPAPGAKNPEADKAKGDADAKARADKLAAQLRGKPLSAFVAAAKQDTDDITTKASGGDLGTKLPAELGTLSEDVRAPLVKSTGSLVGPLQDPTSKDYYLFFVSGRKLELPKDYDKKKAELFKAFEEQQDGTAWSAFTTKLAAANKPTIEDPALVAYNIQTKQLATGAPDQQKALREEAIAKYEEALTYAAPSDATAIRYNLAQLYAAAGQSEKQLATLKTAATDTRDRAVKLEYARALGASGKKEEAVKLAEEISSDIDKNPSPPPQFSLGGQQGGPDDTTRFQIAGLLEQMGKKDLAEKERAKVKPAAPAGLPPGMSFGGAGSGITTSSGGGQTITINKPSGAKPAPKPAGKPAVKVNP